MVCQSQSSILATTIWQPDPHLCQGMQHASSHPCHGIKGSSPSHPSCTASLLCFLLRSLFCLFSPARCLLALITMYVHAHILSRYVSIPCFAHLNADLVQVQCSFTDTFCLHASLDISLFDLMSSIVPTYAPSCQCCCGAQVSVRTVIVSNVRHMGQASYSIPFMMTFTCTQINI